MRARIDIEAHGFLCVPQCPRGEIFLLNEFQRIALIATVIRSPPARTVDQLAGNDASATRLSPTIRVSLHLGSSHARHDTPAFHFHFQPQLVSGRHWAPELRALDPGKHHHLVLAIFHFGQQQRTTRLRDGFDDQNARA